MRISFWEPGNPAERFQNLDGARNLRTDTLKRRKTISLYLHQSSPTAAQLSDKRDPFSPQYFPQGKVRVSEHPTALALRNAAQETHSVSSYPELRELAWLTWHGALAHKSQQPAVDPIGWLVDTRKCEKRKSTSVKYWHSIEVKLLSA